jgi:L-fuculose-phosphate aldolase
MQYMSERRKLLQMATDMWERRLTNAAGGNLAMRVDDNRILLSPSMMSEHKHCRIEIEEPLLIDYDCNILEGTGAFSREGRMHALIMKNIPEVNGVIHAHPFYTMVYVAACKPIPQVSEATLKMGETGLINQAKAYSMELAENAYEYFLPMREQLKITGLCALLPYHGTVAVGKHIEQAFSVVERVESDAVCNLFGKLI